MEGTKDQTKLYSVNLNNVLNFVGASEYIRRIKQQGRTIRDLIRTITYNKTETPGFNPCIYTFGSAIEGTTSPGLQSDVDCLICCGHPEVVEEISDTDVKERLLMMITDKSAQPGYAKLQNNFQDEVKDFFKNCEVLKYNPWETDEINGPARTILKSTEMPGLCSADYVIAFRCRTWPKQACNWLQRKRSSGFPNEDMIKQLTQYGCFLVPVGHHKSEERHLQWRLSFSVQEREIMLSLNEIQFQTYIVLKMINNDFIKPNVPPKSLTSYHCKTCLFYELENLAVELWTSQNLVTCVSTCLQRLLQWFIKNGFIPNYFIPEENMWKGNNETREIIVQILRSLLDNTPMFLTEIKCDSVGLFLQHSVNGTNLNSADIIDKLVITKHKLHQYICNSHMQTLDHIIRFVKEHIILAMDESLDSCIAKHNVMIRRMKMDTDPGKILEHTDLERQLVSEYMLPFLYTSLGSQLIVKYLQENGSEAKTRKLNESFEMLNKGKESDSMSGHLKLAAILFKIGRILDSKEILSRPDYDFNPDILTTHCGCRSIMEPVDLCEALENSIWTDKLSTLEIFRQYVAVCVWFLKTEIDLVSKELQYEMFRSTFSQTPRKPHVDNWFDCVAVDADVFLFYMQYKVNQKLGIFPAMAFEQLTMIIKRNTNLSHYDTAHNLLGCLYKERGELEPAWRCFMESWFYRPDHNAAKWHMAIMLYEAALNESEMKDPGDEILYTRL